MQGPMGPWPKNVGVNWPISMNARGNSVFNVVTLPATLIGIFEQDQQSGKVTAVALKDMPATGNLTFTNAGTCSPAINNRDEIALVGSVKGTGSPNGISLFFRSPDGALQPILVPGQGLPDGKKGRLDNGTFPSIT